MEVKVTIKNLPQIRAAFNKAPNLMRRGLVRAINKSLVHIEGKSKLEAPVRTGRLRSSTGGGSFKGGSFVKGTGLDVATLSRLSGSIGPTVNYAIFVHEGTRFQKANPFLKRAVGQSEGYIDRVFEEETQNVLNQIGRAT